MQHEALCREEHSVPERDHECQGHDAIPRAREKLQADSGGEAGAQNDRNGAHAPGHVRYRGLALVALGCFNHVVGQAVAGNKEQHDQDQDPDHKPGSVHGTFSVSGKPTWLPSSSSV